MLADNFNIAFKNIRERKSRVFLTLLGIAIGIMAIVALMSIGAGMQQAVIGELSGLSDTVIVTTGNVEVSPMGGGFTETYGVYFNDRDIEDIERISGIKSVDEVMFGGANIEFSGETERVAVMGLAAERMAEFFGIEFLGLDEGEFMTENDQSKCVIGYNIAHELFDIDLKIGNKIEINGNNFVVNGIYKKQGAGISIPTDDYIHLTSRDFKKATGQENISGILIKVADVGNVEIIADEIELAINENHGDNDFANAITMSSILESVQQVIGIINAVLIGIAAIALVVASIGIMNTMLTSVMERTHEIGIMKAIGARNTDIMSIFIMEGILISIIGGVVGVILGLAASSGFSSMSSSNFMGSPIPITPVVTISSVVISLLIAVLVGVLSSLYPARKAAKMSPIEAVRYE
jgi:putative ABC transport system permease protein